jgi:hypothetical protein
VPAVRAFGIAAAGEFGHGAHQSAGRPRSRIYVDIEGGKRPPVQPVGAAPEGSASRTRRGRNHAGRRHNPSGFSDAG